MGKGDKKTKKGKRFRGSYGKSRPKSKKIISPNTTPFSSFTKLKLMNILLQTVRIFGFRGINNLELNLTPITVLTGMNNTGKTTFLKALQIALGNRQFISQDDFFISGNSISNEIIIDLKFIPIDSNNKHVEEFPEEWEELFTVDRIRTNIGGDSLLPLRTIITFDSTKNTFKSKQYILSTWPEYFDSASNESWHQTSNGTEKSFFFDEMPFFYMDAQRDIIEDIKMKNSYLGRMISKIEYSPADIERIEDQIKKLNDETVSSSDILTQIKTTLEELDSAMNSSGGVEITPFTKKIRDLNKGLSIYYKDTDESFSMEYHGMGTRSWASLLTLKSFISVLKNNNGTGSPFFPILAIEEPEAHLHPNAQKNLYSQISDIPGQKIISTHSPYVVASAELHQIKNLYKKGANIECGLIDTTVLSPEDIRKIERQVINTRGEIFFSKAIVFFEGETEEQAFPIFAKKHFSRTAVEMSIDFIGVGGNGGYLPFLRVAEGLNIPWFIFSDAEPSVVTSVKNQFTASGTSRSESDVVFFVDSGNDFEGQLIIDGYESEIRNAILAIDLPLCQNAEHKAAKTTEINGLSPSDLLLKMKGAKTQMGPAVAQAIVNSTKALPPKVLALFNKINTIL